ncbi:MAG: helicase-associated domain-containing protein [Thermoflexales bacterium]|nr:helicase-associated domain-containing protein [Thermoflexales bacterium]MDW8292756.1 helicase-associated domain-containing protein [Anaerolineae bacterium]
MRALRACLQDEPLAYLVALAELWDVSVVAASLQEMAEALAAHMLRPQALHAALDRLPQAARDALIALIDAGGKMPLARFERRFGAMRVMGPSRFEREQPWRAPQNAAETLRYHGFIFRAFDRIAGEATEVVFVPSDLLAQVRSSLGRTPAEPVQPSPPPPASTPHADEAAPILDDLTTLLCQVHNTVVRLTAEGQWDAASRRAVASMLRDADGALDGNPNGRFAFLTHLLNRLGWVRLVNRRLRLVAQPVQRWLQSPEAEQREVLYRAWLEDEAWNDLAHVEGLRLETAYGWTNNPRRERQAILALWEQWSAQSAQEISPAAVEAFVGFVREHHPDFARPDGRYDTWHIRDAQTGAFLDGFEHWDSVEGALIRYVLTKPLRWLRETAPLACALAPHQAPITVTTDGHIIVVATHRWLRFQVSRVADWVSTNADNTYTYALTPAALMRARAQGITPQRVVAFLEQHSGNALPKGVREALSRWGARGTEARLVACALLQTADAATAEALLRLPAVRRALVARLSATRLLLRLNAVKDVRAAALAEGLLIEIEQHRSEAR